MRWPPLAARVAVSGGAVPFRLWVPLVLVWLVVLVLLLPVLVLLTLAALVLPRRWRIGPIAQGTWVALCETRGSSLELERDRRNVTIELH